MNRAPGEEGKEHQFVLIGQYSEIHDLIRPEPQPADPSSPALFCDRVKIFTDGGLGASTAALLEPYSDDADGKNREEEDDSRNLFALDPRDISLENNGLT